MLQAGAERRRGGLQPDPAVTRHPPAVDVVGAAALGVIGLLSAWLPAYTDRKEFWTIDGDVVRWIGVILYAAGGALRLWPVFVLGRRFSCLLYTSDAADERS